MILCLLLSFIGIGDENSGIARLAASMPPDNSPPVSLATNSPAAWIAVLRSRQFEKGVTADLYQDLTEARASVFDPLYSQPAPSSWVRELFPRYLEILPFLLLAINLIGCVVLWKRRHLRRWGRSLTLAVLWLCLMLLALLPTHSDPRPAAIVKTPGILLRQGNGLSYPPVENRLGPVSLAAGVESVFLAQRPNGWVQIQLHDGARGWLPRDAVYLVGISHLQLLD